jgi:hypothetical protein
MAGFARRVPEVTAMRPPIARLFGAVRAAPMLADPPALARA